MLLSPCYYASDVLEWNLKLLMSGVDTVYQDSARLVQYEKKQALNRQARQQFIQKRVSERTHTHCQGKDQESWDCEFEPVAH